MKEAESKNLFNKVAAQINYSTCLLDQRKRNVFFSLLEQNWNARLNTKLYLKNNKKNRISFFDTQFAMLLSLFLRKSQLQQQFQLINHKII